MKLDTPQQRFHAKQRIQNLIESGHLREAEEALNNFERAVPDDHDLYMLKGVFYILSGRNKEAIHTMRKGLEINPRHYNLLFNLAHLLEHQGDIMGAFNLYRQAEYNIQTPQQALDLKERVTAIKNMIKSQISIDDKGYLIKVIAGKQTYNVEFLLEELMVRKKLLYTILEHLDTEAKTMLEIECGPGIISRIVSDVGLETTGIDSNNKEITRALFFEMQEQVRLRDKINIKELYNISATEGDLDQLSSYDVIVLAPSSFNWYLKDNTKKIQKTINNIAHKATRQMFIYLPQAEENERQKRVQVKSLLETANIADDAVVQSIKGKTSFPGDLYELSRVKKVRNRTRTIPFGLDSIKSSSSIIEVELEKCRDIQYFSYTTNGWHPFTATIEEHLKNPDKPYNKSILKKFYDAFQPKNRQEQWLEEEKKSIKPLCQGWPNYPWDLMAKVIPKRFFTDLLRERGGNQHFGPNSYTFGKDQYKRLINTYKMITMNGYHPEIFPDGYVKGFLQVKDNDYRFIIVEGQHRIAALSLMGVETLYCKFIQEEHHPQIVNYNERDDWKQVKNGLYTREVAERIFIKFFKENGSEKARRLGLINEA